jgi:hypothetical protein
MDSRFRGDYVIWKSSKDLCEVRPSPWLNGIQPLRFILAAFHEHKEDSP